MRKGLILLTATIASLGSVAVATPASAQYYGHDRGYHRGWNGGGYGHHRGYDRRAYWRHDRYRDYRWHHRGYGRGYDRGYYGRHHRGW